MTTDAPDLAHELHTVERARAGDHGAFVELYRQDAPPAWRLALALTADADLAADAVARSFARVLAPARPGTVVSELPFRVRLLAATRHMVLDQGTASAPGSGDHLAERRDDDPRSARVVEVMQAFHQLPERWRTSLWLAVVEGVPPAEGAIVLGVATADADELLVRAAAGLRSQWTRDRMAAGEEAPAGPEHLERLLQTVLPLPIDLFEVAEERWRRGQSPVVGVLGLTVAGRPVPRWAERGLLAAAGALIVAGIASAVVVDHDPDHAVRTTQTASPDTSTTFGAPAPLDAPASKATGDSEDDSADGDAPSLAPLLGQAGRSVGTGSPVAADSASPATSAPPGTTAPATSTSAAGAPPTTTTTQPKGAQVTAGLGSALALGLGPCAGLEIGGQVIGCKPDPDTGVTVHGNLLSP